MLPHMSVLKALAAVVVISLFAGGVAMAADLTVSVADQDGMPVENAVVTLTSADAVAVKPASPAPRIIDQQRETFLPLVTIVPRGGQIVFTNNDQTRHHVYSFSQIKKFDLVLNPGEKSSPVIFDLEGVATIGCNIHDGMIAYAFVAASPFNGLTGADGRAAIVKLTAGNYIARLWHPRTKPGAQPAEQQIAVGATATAIEFTVPLMAERPHSSHHRSY